MNGRKFFLIALFALALPGLAAARQQPPQQKSGGDSSRMEDMPGMTMNRDMPGMKSESVDGEKDQQAEHGAMDAMSHMHHHQMGPHMYMTALRSAQPEDWTKADAIAWQLRESIEKYKDYRAALADGFRIFMPNLPQSEYHFTNYYNGYLESFTFDPARPTSLLYKKTKTGYDLIGAMYTMPKRVNEEQLNERVPLSIASGTCIPNSACRPGTSAGTPISPSSVYRAPLSAKRPAPMPAARFIP